MLPVLRKMAIEMKTSVNIPKMNAWMNPTKISRNIKGAAPGTAKKSR